MGAVVVPDLRAPAGPAGAKTKSTVPDGDGAGRSAPRNGASTGDEGVGPP